MKNQRTDLNPREGEEPQPQEMKVVDPFEDKGQSGQRS